MIVFDSSTLILVAKIELLELFLDASKVAVAIPAEVERECCHTKKTFDSMLIQKEIERSRINVISVRNRTLVGRLQSDFSLGTGEAEALALAMKEKADLFCTDDKTAINACKVLGLPFTTALAILIRSCEKRVICRDAAMSKLSLLARYGRYGNTIVGDAMSRLEAMR